MDREPPVIAANFKIKPHAHNKENTSLRENAIWGLAGNYSAM